MITKEQLAELKLIYKKNFGKDLNDDEALSIGTSIINLFKIVSDYQFSSQNSKANMK